MPEKLETSHREDEQEDDQQHSNSEKRAHTRSEILQNELKGLFVTEHFEQS